MPRLQERPGRKGQTCPLCRDPVRPGAAGSWTCGACGTVHHGECARELGGCATLGCRGQARRGSSRRARPGDFGPVPTGDAAPGRLAEVEAGRGRDGLPAVGDVGAWSARARRADRRGLGLLGLGGVLVAVAASLVAYLASGAVIGPPVTALWAVFGVLGSGVGGLFATGRGAKALLRSERRGLRLLGRTLLVGMALLLFLPVAAVFTGGPIAGALGLIDGVSLTPGLVGAFAVGLVPTGLTFLLVLAAWGVGE